MAPIRAHFDGKVIVPEEPVRLPAGQAVLVRLKAVPTRRARRGRSVLKWIAENAVEAAEYPPDFSARHDYYIYGGARKRS